METNKDIIKKTKLEQGSYKDAMVSFWESGYMSKAKVERFYFGDVEIKGNWVYVNPKKEASLYLNDYFGNKSFSYFGFNTYTKPFKKKIDGRQVITLITDKAEITKFLSIKSIVPTHSMNHQYNTYPDDADGMIMEMADKLGYL